MRTTAIIPMKAHNVRLPGKNVKMLAGKPLYQHLTDTVLASRFDQLIFDLNGESLVEEVSEYLRSRDIPERHARISRRPSKYCDDKIGGNQLLERFMDDWDDDDIIAQMHVTSPLLKLATLNGALNILISDRRRASLFSATRIVQRVWMRTPNGSEAVNFDPDGPTLRTQDLSECGHENGAFFMFRGGYFKERKQRNHADSIVYMLDFPETVDVDTEKDFQLAEVVMEYLNAQANDTPSDL
jgi:CMP-N-acetylneuraminic acid synthetase